MSISEFNILLFFIWVLLVPLTPSPAHVSGLNCRAARMLLQSREKCETLLGGRRMLRYEVLRVLMTVGGGGKAKVKGECLGWIIQSKVIKT